MSVQIRDNLITRNSWNPSSASSFETERFISLLSFLKNSDENWTFPSLSSIYRSHRFEIFSREGRFGPRGAKERVTTSKNVRQSIELPHNTLELRVTSRGHRRFPLTNLQFETSPLMAGEVREITPISARNSNNFYIRTRFDLRSTPLRIQIYLLQYKDRFVKILSRSQNELSTVERCNLKILESPKTPWKPPASGPFNYEAKKNRFDEKLTKKKGKGVHRYIGKSFVTPPAPLVR